MLSPQNQLLSQAFIDVLQRQAFLFADPISLDLLQVPDSGWVRAMVSFNGPFSGAVELDLASELQAEAAANILGVEMDGTLSQESGDDALKELLNVVCGHLLTTLAGDRATFDLGIPQLLSQSPDPSDAPLTAPNGLGFEIDGHAAVLRVHIVTPS
jgi:CheY-specific phosphatase CheX